MRIHVHRRHAKTAHVVVAHVCRKGTICVLAVRCVWAQCTPWPCALCGLLVSGYICSDTQCGWAGAQTRSSPLGWVLGV